MEEQNRTNEPRASYDRLSGEYAKHLFDELWGQGVSLDFHFFRVGDMEGLLREAGFEVEHVVERGPYGEDVEAQSRRAYVFARKQRGE